MLWVASAFKPTHLISPHRSTISLDPSKSVTLTLVSQYHTRKSFNDNMYTHGISQFAGRFVVYLTKTEHVVMKLLNKYRTSH